MDIKLILIVENRIYREGISHFLSDENKFDVLSVFPNCDSAKRTLSLCAVDVVMLDYHLPDAMDMLYFIKHHQPQAKIVILSYENDRDTILQCMKAGIEGLITNNDSMQDLTQCILTVSSGHLCYPADSYSAIQTISPVNSVTPMDVAEETKLTSRQVKVLRLVEQGYSNKDIARTLNIELCTVKNHMHHILGKLDVKNRCEAASVYRRSVGLHS
jgi:DNA-binding NarL/FixJ family response regulator